MVKWFLWDVNIVLNYLSNFHPLDDLHYMTLTSKLLMVVAIATKQIIQTLHIPFQLKNLN